MIRVIVISTWLEIKGEGSLTAAVSSLQYPVRYISFVYFSTAYFNFLSGKGSHWTR